jgi:hypothetical protein
MVKNMYSKTHEQDVAFRATKYVKKQLADHREQTCLLVKSIERRHQKQIAQFDAAGERKVLDTRALLVIRCKGLSDEQQSSATKECDSKIGHFQAFPPSINII